MDYIQGQVHNEVAMRHFFFYGGIYGKNPDITRLIEFINETEGPIKIGIHSTGGEIGLAFLLLDLLHSNVDRIELHVTTYVQSAAFVIWAAYKGYKGVYPGSYGLAHMGVITTQLRDHGVLEEDQKPHGQTMRSIREVHNEIVIPCLTPKEVTRFWAGHDIVIPTARMIGIAKKHNEKNKAKPILLE